ncbi:hypothetical protein PNBC_16400 [Paenibacillus crassostreae]|uniref:Uncharacterized protein n=1 Tax=Paenibacillus crassostreae TaxID=1763538 RepID=A0A167BV34_9BACL|nr:hypothetical protein LPB68_09955 [Paenibacillus crassostreae]OAB72474.1 hypothetical protein PNBC_16400 [Paenibacillus crassostreae]
MINTFKKWFESRCPECNELLTTEKTDLGMVKTCWEGHYTEETYSSLGVTIVYDSKGNTE